MHSSEMERNSDDCEKDVEKMKMAEYMQEHIGEEYKAMISGVTNFGIFVELDNTIEGMVSIRDIEGDRFVFDEAKYKVVGEKSKKTYRIGDKVKVQLIKCTPETRNIDFVIVE